MDFFDHLLAAKQTSEQLQGLVGVYHGTLLGVVTDTADPLKLGRVRVAFPSKGARSESDWLLKGTPCYGLSLPLPSVGDTVEVSFINGDPHKGIYRGLIHNQVNPYGPSDRLTFKLGPLTMTLAPDGSVAFSGVSSFTLNGKEVTVLGAKDNTGDTLITKGY